VCFPVADEMVLNRALDLVCGNAMLLGNVLKLVGDHAKDLGEDDSLHAILGRVIDGRSIKEDVVNEFIALQGEQNMVVLPGVACRSRIQSNRDKRMNILYHVGLRVEHGNDGDGDITPSGWG
jgi:hypothetical protein